VLAFAFERPVGVVDTNVGRVLARWAGRRLRSAEAQLLADRLAHTAAATLDAANASGGGAADGGAADAVGPGAGAGAGAGVSGVSGVSGADSGAGGVSRSWVWNQAVMELGGTVCRPRRPRCEACPVRPWCGWAAAGLAPPDPADGSAGVSTGQPRFEGSDRQGRGRLVDALCRGPVATADVAAVMGWPGDPARADRVAVGLIADGLAVRDGDQLRLP
jgi:A/G-specific adenine glycosylase